jgi:acetyl esterase/lipase
MHRTLFLIFVLDFAGVVIAEEAPGPLIHPTIAKVPYGGDPHQFVDVYQAHSTGPSPVVVYIHGGGWWGGTAGGIARTDVFGKHNQRGEGLRRVLASGVSIVAVEYRLITQARKAAITPPVEWPLRDAARAVQFIRHKAAEWNIDKERLGLTGSSAGGCSSLWLAMHPDMADPQSSDPVAWESSRPACIGILNAQSSLDPQQLQQWFQSPRYGGHAFGFFKTEGGREVSDMAACLAARDSIMPWIREYSPIEHASGDDPPVFLNYSAAPQPAGRPQLDSVHGAAHGIRLKETLDALGVEATVSYPGAAGWSDEAHIDFLLRKLEKR